MAGRPSSRDNSSPYKQGLRIKEHVDNREERRNNVETNSKPIVLWTGYGRDKPVTKRTKLLPNTSSTKRRRNQQRHQCVCLSSLSQGIPCDYNRNEVLNERRKNACRRDRRNERKGYLLSQLTIYTQHMLRRLHIETGLFYNKKNA